MQVSYLPLSAGGGGRRTDTGLCRCRAAAAAVGDVRRVVDVYSQAITTSTTACYLPENTRERRDLLAARRRFIGSQQTATTTTTTIDTMPTSRRHRRTRQRQRQRQRQAIVSLITTDRPDHQRQSPFGPAITALVVRRET